MNLERYSVKDRYMLAVSVSHNSSVALMRNGEIVAAALEERFCRKKNYVGYPKQAIDYCLGKIGVSGDNIARVAYTTIDNPGLFIKAQTTTQFSLRDYIDYFGDRYYRKRMQGENCLDYLRWLNTDPKFNDDQQHFDFSYINDTVLSDAKLDAELFRKEQARVLGNHLGISPERVEFLDHHKCHAYYAYFGSPFRREPCLSVTLDGWGDGRNQTVWEVNKDKVKLLAESTENDLGRIYKMATLILGMRPDEHEFKVMGLAPYAKSSYVAKAMTYIENICDVDGLRIVSKDRPRDLYAYLLESWKDQRFDNIAGAVQAYTELISCRLLASVVRQTGIRRVVLSGGIAMNVKMNKKISELDEIDEMFVCGSGGDESLSIGGCYVLNEAFNDSAPLTNLYLGYDIGDQMATFDAVALSERFNVRTDVSLAEVAALLADGDIVAVIRGCAEFGARALGNRSILADPSRRESVKKINDAIKNRDFWMPFALSVLEDRQHQYLLNPKQLLSPFMAISLDARPEMHDKIVAGSHPYDLTVRPQFVSREHATAYHKLISEFEQLTGIAALLNTSFNLHGEPIVNTIEDALHTFERSGLDHLLINDSVLISKRKSE
jgi:carbamoyltransferase